MIKTKIKLDKDFIAGFLEGDGTILHFNMKNKQGYNFFRPIIRFCNNDESTLLKIQNFLGKGVIYIQTYDNENKPTYYLQYDSKKRVVGVLNKINNIYLSKHRRSQLLPILKKINFNFTFNDSINIKWIAGFAVAEGYKTIISSVKKNKKYSYTRYGITQNNKKLLVKIQKILKENDIDSTIVYKKKGTYEVHINRLKSVAKFEEVFKTC